ncbi:unnamed protein product [Ectocarpus sp. 12 AP-2014]
MEELRDDLERTLTSISPVKEGTGESILDRTLRSDNSGELFFEELASLEAKDRTKVAGVASGGRVSQYPIGEIFEDLYRETHGLPPRKQNHAYVQHDGDEGNCRPEEIHGAPKVESSAPPAAAVREEGGGGSGGHDGGGGEGCCELATDPDVVRLLAELQAGLVDDPNCCSDGSDAEVGEEGKGRAEEEEGEEDDDDDNGDKKKETDEGDRVAHQEGQEEAARDETKDGTNGPRLVSKEQHPAGGESAAAAAMAAAAAAGKERASSTRGGEHHNPEVVRWVDVSRMKIDGGGPQARPRSAPSSCLSAWGFSRLSSRASSSSRLTRTVSQRLMEATREVEGQRAPEAQGGGGDHGRGAGRGEAAGRLRPSTSASRITKADERIDVVKQNAEALQASMSVKRTRYLNSRKPRAARWSPRDRDLPLGPRGQPSASRAASRSGAPPPAAVRQRPKTAVAKNRRHRPYNSRGHAGNTNKGNPLLNRRETEFLFGAGTAPEVAAAAVAATAAEEDDDDDVSRRAPSLRKTTLGRMLRRSSASSFSPSNGGDARQRNNRPKLSECSSSSASSLYRRPLSAGNACSGFLFLEDGKRRAGRGTAQAIDHDTSCAKHTLGAVPRAGKHAAVAQAAATRARRRPSSAAPGNGCSRRRDRPSSPSQTSSHHYGRHQETAGGDRTRTRTRRDSPSSRQNDTGGGQIPAARSSLARTRGDHHEAAAVASQGCGNQGVGTTPAAGGRAGREPAAMMNARQALEATIREAVDTVSPVEQFVNARKTIADMKQINTKDSTGDILLSTQGMTRARIADDCWSSEAQRQYRG